MHDATTRPRQATFTLTLALLLVALLVGPVPAAQAVESLGPGPAASGGDVPDEPVGGARLGNRGLVVPAGAIAPPTVTAQAWLVADLDSGEVLGARDPHGLYAPASTLKVLTALTFLPRVPPDRMLQPVFDDVAVDGSKVGLVETMTYPASEVFQSMLLMSGNDAASVMARTAGSLEEGVDLMNETARDLQAYDTVARTPHGLDAEGQSSSAYDLAVIGRAALAREDFRRIVSTRCTDISAPESARLPICNKNKLLGTYDGAFGVKNGYTVAAQASFVGAAERDGRRLVVTLLAAAPRVWEEGAQLLDWGFALRADKAVGQLAAPLAGSPAAEPAQAGAAGDGTGTDGDGRAALVAGGSGTDGGLLNGVALVVLVGAAAVIGGLRVRAVGLQRRRRAHRRQREDRRRRAEIRAATRTATGRRVSP